MINRFILRKIKYITIIVLSIFAFEFSFPHLALAQVTTEPTIVPQQQSVVQITTTAERLPETPDRPQPTAQKVLKLTVTAYSSSVEECGNTPFITASGTKVRDGVIAANFLPIGSKVRFPDQFGNKIFVVEDRMASRFSKRADIWMPNRELAIQWGVRHIKMEIL